MVMSNSFSHSIRRQGPAFFFNGQLLPCASAEHMAATHALSKMRADAPKASEFLHYEVRTERETKSGSEQRSNVEAAWLVVTLTYVLFPASYSNNCPPLLGAYTAVFQTSQLTR